MTDFLWEHYDGEIFSDADYNDLDWKTYNSMCREGGFFEVPNEEGKIIGRKYIWVAGKVINHKVNGKW